MADSSCASCSAARAPFGFSGESGAYWLCYECWLMTPIGQQQANNQSRSLHEQDDDNDA